MSILITFRHLEQGRQRVSEPGQHLLIGRIVVVAAMMGIFTVDQANQHLSCLQARLGQAVRGFRFLKDPLFLASSVFVKKPQRIMALSFIMVLCLLISRLAEFRLRSRLAETQQTIPDQVQKPTARPTRTSIIPLAETVECGIE